MVVPGQHADASGSEITGSGAVSRDEAQAAFSVVQGAFSEMTSEHEKIKSGLQPLASHVGAMHAEQAGELANVVHGAQEALQRSSLIKTELESRLQTSEIQQAHAKEVAELAQRRSEEALLQSEGTKQEHEFAMAHLEQKMHLAATKAKFQADRAAEQASQAAQEARQTASVVPQHSKQLQKLHAELEQMWLWAVEQ